MPQNTCIVCGFKGTLEHDGMCRLCVLEFEAGLNDWQAGVDASRESELPTEAA